MSWAAIALLIIAAVALLGMAYALGSGLMDRWSFRTSIVRRRVIVNLTSGRSFTGVLYAQRGPLLVLRDASARDNGREVAMVGEVVVERTHVEFVQVIPS